MLSFLFTCIMFVVLKVNVLLFINFPCRLLFATVVFVLGMAKGPDGIQKTSPSLSFKTILIPVSIPT